MPNPKKANKPKGDLAEEGPSGAADWPEGHGGDTTTANGNDNAVLAAIASLRSELHTVKADICDKIDERIADVSVTLRAEIAALKSEIDLNITALKTQTESQAKTLQGLEQSATDTADRVAELETQVKHLTRQVDRINGKCLDLEGRSKRQNLRIMGLKEGTEQGQAPREFAAGLLKEVLELKEKPIIDRAHRALRQRPGDGEPPRHFILKIHYGHDFEDIFRRITSKKDLTFQGQRIQMFRDLPQEVAKARAAFTPVRKMLRGKPGVRFGIMYPAKLRVTHDGRERMFTDPKEALAYAERHFNTE